MEIIFFIKKKHHKDVYCYKLYAASKEFLHLLDDKLSNSTLVEH